MLGEYLWLIPMIVLLAILVIWHKDESEFYEVDEFKNFQDSYGGNK